MKHDIVYSAPADLLGAAEKQMESIPQERLFNDSQYQKLRERWCTGMFGVGYTRYVDPCEVAVNEGAYRADVDMFLRTTGREWDFQIAEVQDPARRRGQEYKKLAERRIRVVPYEPERGSREGIQWLVAGAQKKKEKSYSGGTELNLLLYANFDAVGLEQAALIKALLPFSAHFASLWVVTSLHVCSVFSQPGLGEIKSGWGVVRAIYDYYR
jgi:hypothetical protein